VYAGWVDPSKILMVNSFSSELAKLVANAMLAQRISSINSISAICDQTGADIDEIAAAIGRDTRLGSKFLQAGVGFGGSCFRKDILSLVYLARTLHLPEVAEYWSSVLTINDFQMDRFTQRVVRRLHGALAGKKITVLGFAFKQDTNDTRDSPAIHVIKAIICERPAEIAIFDPGCSPEEISQAIRSASDEADLGGPSGPVKPYFNAYEACNNSSAVLILTPWKQFRSSRPSKDEAKNLVPVTPTPTEKPHNPADECEILIEEPPCPSDCSLCNFSSTGKTAVAHEKLDWSLIASTMREPKWLFDGRNVVDNESMSALGFRPENLGKPLK
jgi:UDPglucose 6-dehydrogenase